MADVEMAGPEAEDVVDMGYEEAAPTPRRRGSMSQTEQRERRASIKAIMGDGSLTPMEKRLSIQHLMDGRRASLTGGPGSVQSVSAASSVTAADSTSYGSNPYGYGDDADNPYGYGYEVDNGNDASMEHRGCAGGGDAYAICNDFTRRAEMTRPYCSHYERNCTIISPCCGAAFGCRICHDDCPALPPKINNGGRRYHRSASLPSSFTSMEQPQMQEDNQHEIDRFAIREVICRECFTRQSSKT